MTDKINNFLEESNETELLTAYNEAGHQDEKDMIFTEIQQRWSEHDCGQEQGCRICEVYYELTH